MNYTEKQITEKAIQVLKDIDGKYYRENCIAKVSFHKNDEIHFPKNKTLDTWIISISSLFNNTDFMIISDETGEPLYYQNFNYTMTELMLKDNGVYGYKE